MTDAALRQAVKAELAADVSQRPAVACVYNMGIIVRTKERLFSIDLCCPEGEEAVLMRWP